MKYPKDFIGKYWSSIFQKSEAEWVWNNMLVILGRTGNKWRELHWDEYVVERTKDGEFSQGEKHYFEQSLPYTTSE